MIQGRYLDRYATANGFSIEQKRRSSSSYTEGVPTAWSLRPGTLIGSGMKSVAAVTSSTSGGKKEEGEGEAER